MPTSIFDSNFSSSNIKIKCSVEYLYHNIILQIIITRKWDVAFGPFYEIIDEKCYLFNMTSIDTLKLYCLMINIIIFKYTLSVSKARIVAIRTIKWQKIIWPYKYENLTWNSIWQIGSLWQNCQIKSLMCQICWYPTMYFVLIVK